MNGAEDGPRVFVPRDVVALLRKLAAISERHGPSPDLYRGMRYCNGCGQTYPCPDRRILDGEAVES